MVWLRIIRLTEMRMMKVVTSLTGLSKAVVYQQIDLVKTTHRAGVTVKDWLQLFQTLLYPATTYPFHFGSMP